jgi:hypothetical protein
MESNLNSPEETRAFAGELLFITQHFEEVIDAAIKLVYSDLKKFDREAFLKNDKKTLGMLLKELRLRVKIDFDIDKILIDLLSQRNFFIHRLSREPGFDCESIEGRKKIWEFYKRYFLNLETGCMTFGNIIYEFSLNIGVQPPDTEDREHKIASLQSYAAISNRIKPKGKKDGGDNSAALHSSP